MTRTRTSPEVKPSVAIDTIEQFGVTMAYDAAGAVDIANVKFSYVANNRAADGSVIESQVRELDFQGLPGAVKTDLRAIYNRVLADAEASGLIGAGTDTDDLP